MSVTALESRLAALWETPQSAYGWFATVDHKELGVRYLVTAFAFLVLGGLEALVMRLQLAQSNMGILTPEAYNQIFTMHGATMIFWYAAPGYGRELKRRSYEFYGAGSASADPPSYSADRPEQRNTGDVGRNLDGTHVVHLRVWCRLLSWVQQRSLGRRNTPRTEVSIDSAFGLAEQQFGSRLGRAPTYKRTL
jgi:hypothetical protein